MADNAPVMIWLAGLDKKRNFLNKTWLEFTGQQQLTGKKDSWKEAIHPEDLPTYESFYDSSFMPAKHFRLNIG